MDGKHPMFIGRDGGGFDGNLSKNTSRKRLETANKPPGKRLTSSTSLIQACTSSALDAMPTILKKVITDRALSTQV